MSGPVRRSWNPDEGQTINTNKYVIDAAPDHFDQINARTFDCWQRFPPSDPHVS